MFKTKVSWVDAAILLLMCALTVASFLLPMQKKEQAQSLLVISNEGTKSYSLSKNQEIRLFQNGITLTVEIKDGKVRVKESDCPDRICSQTGWIEKSGESILCVPAGVKLTLTGGGDADVDFVAG